MSLPCRVSHGSWDNEFTICGKTIDSLLYDEYVLDMNYNEFERWFGELVKDQRACKRCVIEINKEAQLRRDKSKGFDDEVNTPVL